jgi:hypothetical protein
MRGDGKNGGKKQRRKITQKTGIKITKRKMKMI